MVDFDVKVNIDRSQLGRYFTKGNMTIPVRAAGWEVKREFGVGTGAPDPVFRRNLSSCEVESKEIAAKGVSDVLSGVSSREEAIRSMSVQYGSLMRGQ